MPRLEWIAKTLADRWDHIFRQREDADPYRVSVVTTPAMYFDRLRAPFELRYAIDHLPNGFDIVRSLLAEGKGIAILRVPRVPRLARQSAVRLAKTQQQIVEPWLARLIFTEKVPVIDSEMLYQCQQEGTDPYADAKEILDHRTGMIRFALVDLKGRGSLPADLEKIEQLNRVIEPLSAAYLYHRLNEDWTEKNLRIVSTVLRVIILALVLRWLISLSIIATFILAALADDVARQIGMFLSLRYAGYTRKQVRGEALPYLVPLLIGIGLVLWSISFYGIGSNGMSGFIFGLAVISFPLFDVIRRLISLRMIYRKLDREGRLFEDARRSPTSYAVYELRRNKLAWGLVFGAVITPFFCALIFILSRGMPLNAWTLSICGIIDVLFAIAWRHVIRYTDRIRFISTMMVRMQGMGHRS